MWSFDQLLIVGLIFIVAIMIGIFLGYRYGKNIAQEQYEEQQVSRDRLNYRYSEHDQNIRYLVQKRMEELRNKTETDFVGLALYDLMNEEIRWRLAVGAMNERYKRIVIRMGKGIAGEVVQLNRTIKIENFPNQILGDPIEYPILLVEHLVSVLAVPVSYQNRIHGVLLIGQRSSRTFTESDEEVTFAIGQQVAKDLETANVYERIIYESGESKNEQTKINDSLLIRFLNESQQQLIQANKGILDFEVLDQSMIEIPISIQRILIQNLEEIFEIVNQNQDDRVEISIGRADSHLLVECKSNRSIATTKEVFKNIYQRIGELGGSISSYLEENQIHFVMQLPIWSYKNPFNK
ncbi:MAG: GAF domain-containing protein [Tepidibacillus sp.]